MEREGPGGRGQLKRRDGNGKTSARGESRVAEMLVLEARPVRGSVSRICVGQQPPRAQLVFQQGISSRYERRGGYADCERGWRLTAGGANGRVL